MDIDHEVIVVGGGAAGLSAGIALARSRRSVLVIDAGEPRNAPAEGVHNFLTRDGVAPRDLVDQGRAELRALRRRGAPGRVLSRPSRSTTGSPWCSTTARGWWRGGSS